MISFAVWVMPVLLVPSVTALPMNGLAASSRFLITSMTLPPLTRASSILVAVLDVALYWVSLALIQLFRFVYGVAAVVDLGSVGNGGSEASGILIHHGGIGAVGYGGSDLICFLQVVGCIGSIRNVGIGLTGNGVDGGLLATINQLGFFFGCTAEIGSSLAISLAHFLSFSLIRQLGRSIGTGIVRHFLYVIGTGSIRFLHR